LGGAGPERGVRHGGAGVGREELLRQPERGQRPGRAGREPVGLPTRHGAADAQLRRPGPGLPGGGAARAEAGDEAVRREGEPDRCRAVRGGGGEEVGLVHSPWSIVLGPRAWNYGPRTMDHGLWTKDN